MWCRFAKTFILKCSWIIVFKFRNYSNFIHRSEKLTYLQNYSFNSTVTRPWTWTFRLLSLCSNFLISGPSLSAYPSLNPHGRRCECFIGSDWVQECFLQKEQTQSFSVSEFIKTNFRIFSMMFLFPNTFPLKVNISSLTTNESKLVFVVQKFSVCLFLTWWLSSE